MKLKHFLVVAFAFVAGMASAQQMPAIPIDPNVRIGKLDNGLTYYIRHNNWPENVANFYIAQRVGSIQEEESQRGLAHFLEHMAFNGSEHFPDSTLLEYTRSLGVEFGSDLNANTGIDQTVYRICNVPTKRQTALDSCLLILRDWSNGLTLVDKEIDQERGVIHQEWQMRTSASMRIFERTLPLQYPGSKYGERLPIGLMSVVDNFKYNELRDYYHKWYHPGNQAIIVVGNIDVDHTEAEIKRLWSDVKKLENATPVVDVPVPDNDKAIYIFDKDKELQQSSITIAMKHDPVDDKAKETVGEIDRILFGSHNVDGLKVITASVPNADTGRLRQMGDVLRDKDASVVAVLATVNEGKITFLAVCGKDAIARGIKAGDLVKQVCCCCGGSGGGKPDSAMGGGKDVTKVDNALAIVDDYVVSKLK